MKPNQPDRIDCGIVSKYEPIPLEEVIFRIMAGALLILGLWLLFGHSLYASAATVPEVKPAHPAHHPVSDMRMADNGYVRQYWHEGGELCGEIHGAEPPYLAATWGGVAQMYYYTSRETAIQWVEKACPNAVEVKR